VTKIPTVNFRRRWSASAAAFAVLLSSNLVSKAAGRAIDDRVILVPQPSLTIFLDWIAPVSDVTVRITDAISRRCQHPGLSTTYSRCRYVLSFTAAQQSMLE